ncbi:MAG: hypothetical protein ACK44F_16650 [Roseococcus sp.]
MALIEWFGWAMTGLGALAILLGLLVPAERARLLAGAPLPLLSGLAALWLTGALDRTTDALTRPAAPPDQQALVAVLHRWAEAYERAENDIARLPMRGARAAEICALGLSEARDWTARVAAIHAAGQAAGIDLALTHRVSAGTANNRASEALAPEGQRTLIQPGTPLHQTIARLRPGDAVRFSGLLFPDRQDCLRETRLTEGGGMTAPRLALQLIAITPLR